MLPSVAVQHIKQGDAQTSATFADRCLSRAATPSESERSPHSHSTRERREHDAHAEGVRPHRRAEGGRQSWTGTAASVARPYVR